MTLFYRHRSTDLSLSQVTEKSPLPAIIVTPSSPSCDKDFSIAFLAPPREPTWRERFSNSAEAMRSRFFSFKARTMVIMTLLLFIMACHLLSHSLAARRPHLHFAPVMRSVDDAGAMGDISGVAAFESSADTAGAGGWFTSFKSLLGNAPVSGREAEFVIREG
jgi:hypothetical protein